MDYKASGVDIDAGNEVVRRIRSLARGTFTSGVLSEIGSFGGLFRLGGAGGDDAVRVASADGVGTKLRVASAYRNNCKGCSASGWAVDAVGSTNILPGNCNPRSSGKSTANCHGP
jgi:phosphoribosylaminoimidazole (AIR) synthetase